MVPGAPPVCLVFTLIFGGKTSAGNGAACTRLCLFPRRILVSKIIDTVVWLARVSDVVLHSESIVKMTTELGSLGPTLLVSVHARLRTTV
jgi:hypothetical protein